MDNEPLEPMEQGKEVGYLLSEIDSAPEKFLEWTEENNIVFYVKGTEMLRVCSNGDFLVKDKKVTNDLEFYERFKEFLGMVGVLG